VNLENIPSEKKNRLKKPHIGMSLWFLLRVIKFSKVDCSDGWITEHNKNHLIVYFGLIV
jgi:hypothetical protein